MTDERLSRRRVVVAGTTGLVAALAGCSDGSGASTDTPSGSDGGGGSGESGGGSGGESTPTPSPEPTTPGPQLQYPGLVAQTDLVVENIVWLATERDGVMRQLRTLANRPVGIARELRNASSVTQGDLTRLEDATTAVAEFVRQNVQPYFRLGKVCDQDSRAPAANGNNTYLQQVKLAAERGDPRALNQALDRLRTFYSNYTKRSYSDSRFPNDIVHERLYDRMTRDDDDNLAFGLFHDSGYVAVCHADKRSADDGDDCDVNDNGVPHHEHTWNGTHVVTAHAHPHDDLHRARDHRNEPKDRLVYAYNRETGGFDVLSDDVPDQQRMDEYAVVRSDIFAPVRLTDRHRNETFFTVSRIDEETIDGDTVDYGENFGDNMVVHLQRFESAEATTRAVDDLLAADVFQQGTARIREDDDDDAREWRRIFYTNGDASLYAYMLDIGQVLVTIAPSETEWGNRVDWPGPVRDTWLGDASPQDT